MKLSSSTSEFLASLQLVARVAAARPVLQTLGGVKIDATGPQAMLLASDSEMGLTVALAAEVERPGAVVIPARLLLDVVRSLPVEPLSIELRSSQQDVELIAGNSTFHLRTLRLEDFPPLPLPEPETRLELPAERFVNTATRVARSASHDDTRPILTGVLVSAAGSVLRMVATDSYRLTIKETKLETELARGFEANVPARALLELARVVQQGGSETLAVSSRQSQVVFEVDGVTLSSRLIDGQFPNYRQLLPEQVEHELRVSTSELLDVVRRVGLLAQKNTPLRLAFTEGELTVSAQTPDVGEAQDKLPVPFHGEPLEIGFNPDFLRDGLESADGGDVVVKLISALRPGVIESADGGGFTYLIMPIRLNV